MSDINRGTGAGGAATNASGKPFEMSTSIIPLLITLGFSKVIVDRTKYGYYYMKKSGADEIKFFIQSSLKKYMKRTFNKELFRCPDEAFLIKNDNKYTIKIIEKKNQNRDGSVEDKLCNAGYFIKEYKECVGENFNIEYAFCLSKFLKKKYLSDTPKFRVMRKLHKEDNITVLFGSDSDYFSKLQKFVDLK